MGLVVIGAAAILAVVLPGRPLVAETEAPSTRPSPLVLAGPVQWNERVPVTAHFAMLDVKAVEFEEDDGVVRGSFIFTFTDGRADGAVDIDLSLLSPDKRVIAQQVLRMPRIRTLPVFIRGHSPAPDKPNRTGLFGFAFRKTQAKDVAAYRLVVTEAP